MYNKIINDARERVFLSEPNDHEELLQIIELLEIIVNNWGEPHQGLFEKYAPAIGRNPWIADTISECLLTWLLSSRSLQMD